MNLIQIQDRLKELPNSPQTMQLLMGYANGQSPVVPPYLALGELQRRNKIMQEQASAQPPQGTVKDQIQQQASGIAALSQQGQAMAQQPQVQPPPMATPQPQQAPQQPVQAAGGGLLSLLMRAAQAKRMNSGGVIAFNEAGSVEDRIREMTDAGEDENSEARRMRLEREAAAYRAQQPKFSDMDPIALRKAAIAADPSLAAADRDTGSEILKRLDEIQAVRRAEIEKQRAEAQAAKPSVFQLLGQAALGTRGQFGRSALGALLGGYGQIQSAADAKALEQEQGLRMREIELQQGRMEAMNKIDEMNRAQAEGRIKDYIKAREDFEKILKDYNISKASLLRGEITATESRAAREESSRQAAEAKRDVAAMAINKPQRVTDYRVRLAIRTKDIMNRTGVDEATAAAQAEREISYATPAGAGVVQRTAADAEKTLKSFKMLNRSQYNDEVKKYGSPEAADAAFKERYMNNTLPPELMPKAAKPAAAPGTKENPIKIPG